MKIEIPDLKEFPECNISGYLIVNKFWREHLLNLFFQGYYAEFYNEVMDTKIENSRMVENLAYALIGQERDMTKLRGYKNENQN